MTAASDALEARLVQLDTDGDSYEVSMLERLDTLASDEPTLWFAVESHGPGYLVLINAGVPGARLFVNTEMTDHIVVMVS